MRSQITGMNTSENYRVIDHTKLDDESTEYDLYLEIITGFTCKSFKYGKHAITRLRDIPTLLTTRQKNKTWHKLLCDNRSYMSKEFVPGYLNACQFNGKVRHTWYVVM